MKKYKSVVLVLLGLAFGIIVGGYVFSNARPRSFLALRECDYCTHPADLLGLVAAIGMQHSPGLIPGVVFETDKVLVLTHPMPRKRYHLVLIPKRDMKNASDISEEDSEYLMEIFRVARKLIKDDHLVHYRFYTNGPGYQLVTYLHFHLVSD